MKNEKGYVLFVALIVLVFIGILGSGLFTIINTTFSQTIKERKDQSIFYVAESGINIKEARLNSLISKAYAESKAHESTFEQKFNNELLSILDAEKNSVYDNSVFSSSFSSFNGKPNATVTIEYSASNPRTFKIVSIGTLDATAKKRRVEKSYTIADTLIQKTTIKVPVTNPGQPPVTPIPEPAVNDFVISGIANNYVTSKVEIHAIPKSNLNMKTKTSFNRNIFTNSIVTPFSNYDNIEFNKTLPSSVPKEIAHIEPTYSTAKPNSNLQLISTPQNLTVDKNMPKLNNGSNNVFNIVANNNVSIVFPDSLLNYNFSSIRFNVTGGGTLNLVFKNTYELDVGRKFIVNAPNTKVNVIFEDYAHIFGEMQVQDIYFPDKRDLNIHTNGKLIASNVYLNKGNIYKHRNGNLKALNMSLKEGSIHVIDKGSFITDHTQLLKGTILTSASSKLITKSLTIKEKGLSVIAGSCIKAQTIYAKNGRVEMGGTLLYDNLYAKEYSAHGFVNVNKKYDECNNSNFTITPPPDVPVTEYITEDEYNYLYDNNFLQSSPLLEIY